MSRAGPDPDVRFFLLGRVAVTVDGIEVPLRGIRRKALLAALVLHRGEVLSADRLLDQVWGEDALVAAATLHSHVSHLRRSLGPAAALIETRPPGYLLRVDDSAVDVARFEQLVADARSAAADGTHQAAIARFDEALELWAGRALPELAELDFAHREADRLEQVRLSALEDRIDAQLAVGQHRVVLPELEALVEAHPLRERLAGQLMVALYRAGRQAEALRVYQRARDALADLGIDPSPALRDLESSILAQAPALDPVAEVAPPPPTAPPPTGAASAAPVAAAGTLPPFLDRDPGEVLVGREREVEQLASAWAEARSGARRVVVVTGEPGVGKTALVAGAARAAADAGALVLAGRCDDAQPFPYQPFSEALHALHAARPATAAGAGDLVGELSRLVPDLMAPGKGEPLGPSAPVDGEWARYRLFEATVAWLAAAGREGPLVLVLDDVHWATPPTLLLLRHLARAPVTMPLLVLVTCRDTEPHGSEVLDDVLADLARQPGVATVGLTGLAAADVAAMVDHVGCDWPAGAAPLASEVHARTGGNPFFVRELLRSYDAADPQAPVPATVRQVITQRVRRLSPSARRALEVASVLGSTFKVRQLLALDGLDDALDGIDEAVRAGLLIDATDQVRFAHALVRDALYQGLRTSDRLGLHLVVARSLARLDPERHLESVASHHWAAGPVSEVEDVVAWNRRAGNRAMSASAFEEAVQYFDRALAARRQGGGTADEECELLLALASAQLGAGDVAATEATLEAAVSLARVHDRSDVIARAALTFEGELVTGGEAWERRLRLVEEARRRLEHERSPLAVRVTAMLAHVLAGIRPGPRVAEVADRAVSDADEIGDEVALAAALHASHQAVPEPANAARRAELAARVVELGTRSGAVPWEMLGRMAHLADRLELGELDAFAAGLDAYADRASEVRRPHDLWRSAVMRATLALFRGELAHAEQLAGSALELGSRWQQPGAMQSYVVQLFLIRWHQGRAVELLEGAEAFAATSPRLPIWQCTLAALYGEAGRRDDAARVVCELVADDFAGLPRDNVWLVSLTMLTEAVTHIADPALALPVLERLRPHGRHNVALGTAVAFGAAWRPIAMLERVVGDLDAAVEHLDLAIAANEAMRSPLYAAEARTTLAAVLDQRHGPGDADRAAALAAAAAEVAGRLGAHRLLGLDRPGPLRHADLR